MRAGASSGQKRPPKLEEEEALQMPATWGASGTDAQVLLGRPGREWLNPKAPSATLPWTPWQCRLHLDATTSPGRVL